MKIVRLALLAAVLATSACQKQEPISGAETKTPVATGDTSQNALDWAGIYEGTLPCADCEGIRTSLTLEMPDKYALSEDYLGKGDKPIISNGNFTWDAAGLVISLDTKPDGRKFKVGEGRIWHLDLVGKVITGTLADKYILTKKP